MEEKYIYLQGDGGGPLRGPPPRPSAPPHFKRPHLATPAGPAGRRRHRRPGSVRQDGILRPAAAGGARAVAGE